MLIRSYIHYVLYYPKQAMGGRELAFMQGLMAKAAKPTISPKAIAPVCLACMTSLDSLVPVMHGKIYLQCPQCSGYLKTLHPEVAYFRGLGKIERISCMLHLYYKHYEIEQLICEQINNYNIDTRR